MQVGNSLRATIPKELAEHLEIAKGDKLVMWADNSHVVIQKEKKA